MLPDQSTKVYGINTTQMTAVDHLHTASNQDIPVYVKEYRGAFPYVMDLLLQNSSWFFADGVIVHNSTVLTGVADDGNGNISNVGNSKRQHATNDKIRGVERIAENKSEDANQKWVTRADVPPDQFAAAVISSARRRYGTWTNGPDDGCLLSERYVVSEESTELLADESEPDKNISKTPNHTERSLRVKILPQLATLGSPALDSLCKDTVGVLKNCFKCNLCRTPICVGSILKCRSFLDKLYVECINDITDLQFRTNCHLAFTIVCASIPLALALIVCVLITQQKMLKTTDKSLKQLQTERQHMHAQNSHNLETLELHGQYTANGRTFDIEYHLDFNDGHFTGHAEDADGEAAVFGTMCWPPNQLSGSIAWRESHHHAVSEVWGTICNHGVLYGIEVQASYKSSYSAASGRIVLQSVKHG